MMLAHTTDTPMQCAGCNLRLVGGAAGHGTYINSATAASVMACSPACAQQKIGDENTDMDLPTAFARATDEQVRNADTVSAWLARTQDPALVDEYFRRAAAAVGLNADAVAQLGADVSTPLSAYCGDPSRLLWAAALLPHANAATVRKGRSEQPVVSLLIDRAAVEMRVELPFAHYSEMLRDAIRLYRNVVGTPATKAFVQKQVVELLIQLTMLNREPTPFMLVVAESDSFVLLDKLLSSSRARPFIPDNTVFAHDGMPIVMKAIESYDRQYEKVKVLMKHGFSPRGYYRGMSPMAKALELNRRDIAYLLAASGAPASDMHVGLTNQLKYGETSDKLDEAFWKSGKVSRWDRWGNVINP